MIKKGMPSPSTARASIAAAGPVSVATSAWRERGMLRVTAIVKVTFGFVEERPMRVVAPRPVHETEAHHRDNPTRSIRAASDLAPFLPRVDVILNGHAWAPGGVPVLQSVARLSVTDARGSSTLLDKQLTIFGDGEAQPFDRMPLVYERAYGGMGHADNPLGVGVGSDTRRPNVLDPRAPRATAGFGPIARSWPARRGALSAAQRRALEEPVAEIPEAFDGSYFQASPPDQRIDAITGDEWIALHGMHPSKPIVRSQLPGARAFARVLATDEVFELRADTIAIDADELSCSVTFRAALDVPSGVPLDAVRLAGAVSVGGAPIDWTDLSATAPVTPVPTGIGGGTVVIEQSSPRGTLEGTVAMPPVADPARWKATLPFTPDARPARVSVSANGPVPGAPWSPVPAAKTAQPARFDETTADPAPLADTQRLSFAEPPAPAPAPSPPPVIPRVEEPSPAPEPPKVAADLWRSDPPPEAAAPAKPTKPAKARPDVYGKFGRR